MSENDAMDLPELGTPEAALRSCINLISRATGQPEEILAFWLDLYYQVRRNMEICSPSPFLRNAMDAALAQANAAVQEQMAKAFGEPPQAPPADPPAPPPPTEKPSKPAKDAGAAAAAKFKRETLAKLEQVLAAGISMGSIAAGDLSFDQILRIRERKPASIATYRLLDDRLRHFLPEGGAQHE